LVHLAFFNIFYSIFCASKCQ